MAIYRSKPTEEFLVLKNEVAQDGSISMQASGLLHYMLSLPIDWHFNLEHLNNHFEKDGKQRIRSGLKELEGSGYLVRKQVRKGGKFAGQDWLVFDKPVKLPQSDNPNAPKPNSSKPKSSTPNSSKPKSKNSTLQKTEQQKTDFTKDRGNKQHTAESLNSNEMDISKVGSYFQERFGRLLGSSEIQLFDSFSNDVSTDMAKFAIDIAKDNGANSVGYIRAIFRNWSQKQLRTLEDVKRDNQDFKSKGKLDSSNDQLDNSKNGVGDEIIDHGNGQVDF